MGTDPTVDESEGAALRAHILADGFPCLGARSSVRKETCETATYNRLDRQDAEVRRLGDDLRSFVQRHSEPRSAYAVHVALDAGFAPQTEMEYEEYLWGVLYRLHQVDRSSWDPRYSSNPQSASFKFSFAGRAFYVVGLSPVATRRARRLPIPALVFNPVWQFERLRDLHQLDSIIDRIRERDLQYDGSVNPNLQFEGVLSDALQYAGRQVDQGWRCPHSSWESAS
jgi:FPC/CPF motif-containing protein YcgG